MFHARRYRDTDGSQYSRQRPSVLLPTEKLIVKEPSIEKGSLAQKLPDYHHPPVTDPCMTVCNYLNSSRPHKDYKTSYSSVFNDPHQAGYGKLSDQPRDPSSNRRLAQKPHLDTVTTPARRDPYAPVKKCLDSFQDQLQKLIK